MSEVVESWPALSFLEGLRPGPDESVELALLASYSADLGSIGATLLALAGKDTDAGRGTPSDFADAVVQELAVLVDERPEEAERRQPRRVSSQPVGGERGVGQHRQERSDPGGEIAQQRRARRQRAAVRAHETQAPGLHGERAPPA